MAEAAGGVAVDHGPLLLASPCPGPSAFDEGAAIDLLLPPPADACLPVLKPGQCYVTAGRKAQGLYGSLPGGREEAVLDGTSVGTRGRASRVRVGLAGGRVAYGYFSRDDDVRELRLCDAADAGWLFRACLDDLAALQKRGDLKDVRPGDDLAALQKRGDLKDVRPGLAEAAALTRAVLARSALPTKSPRPPG